MRQRPIVNPILTRELRARWRSKLSSVLLFCYALFLALAAGMVYASARFSARDSHLLTQMADAGHTLFLTLSGLQIGAWMLLGPALTATSIASERERGLLEMLQMTSLSAARICTGKLWSALGFVVLLMFAPLPMTALCFLLGGVSPAQFSAALALQATTAMCGLCFGLWASAWSRRATTALTLALGGVVVWNIVTCLILIAHSMRSPWANLGGASGWWQSFLLDGVWRTNPWIVFFRENYSVSPAGASWLSSYASLDCLDWVFCGTLQLLASAILLASATRALRKPLDENELSVPKRPSIWTRRLTSSTRSVKSSLNAEDVKLETVPDIKHEWEIGFLSRFESSNPVLEREIRRWGRMRRMGRVVERWTRRAVLLLASAYFLGLIYLLYDIDNRARELFWLVVGVGTILGALIACGLGAMLFARERESGTWEGLQLSLLSSRQIVAGKIVPAMAVCSAFCVVFWLPALLCINGALNFGVATSGLTYLAVHPFQWFFSLSIAIGAAWFCLCWSALISAFTSRVWLAVSWSIGSLLVLFAGSPIMVGVVLNLFTRYNPSSDLILMKFFRLWHPLFAFAAINDSVFTLQRYRTTPWSTTWEFVIATFALGCMMLYLATQRIRQDLRVRRSVR